MTPLMLRDEIERALVGVGIHTSAAIKSIHSPSPSKALGEMTRAYEGLKEASILLEKLCAGVCAVCGSPSAGGRLCSDVCYDYVDYLSIQKNDGRKPVTLDQYKVAHKFRPDQSRSGLVGKTNSRESKHEEKTKGKNSRKEMPSSGV